VAFRPEQAIIQIGSTFVDLGAFCYAARSAIPRKPRRPQGVILSSLRLQRLSQVADVIKLLSAMLNDSSLRPSSVNSVARTFKRFIDWADNNGHYDCLDGNEGTVAAFKSWAAHVEERYRRHEIGSNSAAFTAKNYI